MRFQKRQPAVAATLVPPSASAGSLKNMDVSRPARNAPAHEIHKKSWQHFEHLRTAVARTGQYEEEAPYKAGMGANSHRVQR